MAEKREIKFRAWDNQRRIMSDSFYLEDIKTQPIENVPLWPSIPLGISENDWEFLQYTGLKDKNGKEIYEGDIIKGVFNRYPQNWKVNDLSPYGVSFTRLTIAPLSSPYNFRDMRYREQWEVIGNIYETPELLEVMN